MGYLKMRGMLVRMNSTLPSSVTRIPSQPCSQSYTRALKRAELRVLFGKQGMASGVELGRLWPSVEEVEEELAAKQWRFEDAKREYERIKEETEKKERERKAKIEKKLKNYGEVLAKYEESQRKAEAAKEEKDAVLERRMREIHEYLGYWMDPKDPRFELMLKQKEEEERKAEKLAKRAEILRKKIAQIS